MILPICGRTGRYATRAKQTSPQRARSASLVHRACVHLRVGLIASRGAAPFGPRLGEGAL